MDNGWWSALDSRERYISFICDLGDLTDHTFCSGLWEEYPMVCCSSNLQYQQDLLLSTSSAIINDVTTLREARLASIGYFYFDFRDDDKKSRRNLLSSLLVQLSACSDAFCDILSRYYVAHDNGARQASDKDMTQCLKEMLTLPDQGPVYLIMDALDECPDKSGVPPARGQVLGLVKELVNLHFPGLHICITSRPEVDIGDALGSLASQTVSLQDELGQKNDIAGYVRFVVHSGMSTSMKQWRKDEDRKSVV